MSNVQIVVEDEPPCRADRSRRIAGGDVNHLRSVIRRVVLHEIAHHFGISDERLIEIDRY